MSSPPNKRLEDMTPLERLESLKQYAESKQYTSPGQDGTLPYGSGRGMMAMAFGGLMGYGRNGLEGQYTAPVGPPSYEKSVQPEPQERKKKEKGRFGRWLEKKRGGRKGSRDAGVGELPPEYS